MTRLSADRLAGLAMIWVERLGYLLALAPFLAHYLKTGRGTSSLPGFILDLAAGCAILAVALLMGYARRQKDRVESLRDTLNEAIIHDLKNPMTTIMGCLSCVNDESLEIEQRNKLVDMALHGCRSQMTLLETLVDTSRLEHGELVAQKLKMKTREMLDSCLGDVAGVASHLGVNLNATHSGPMPADFLADPDLLPRTIANLLHNAIKYTPTGGTVSMRTRCEDAGITFEVHDTGIGISPEHIGRLFEKYYRVEGADQTTRRGSGLGLYFCRLVIEAHGGKVSIKSEVGDGTTITFNIPQPSNGVKSHAKSRGAGRPVHAECAR